MHLSSSMFVQTARSEDRRQVCTHEENRETDGKKASQKERRIQQFYIYLLLLGGFLGGLGNCATMSMLWRHSIFEISPLPPALSDLSTDLMTPTATVCLMSRTANRPRGGYSLYDSTHIGLDGTSLAMQASPDLTNLGLFSRDLPLRRSIFSMSSANLQAMWAVWQSSTGA